jgi:hypothetical protein
MWYVLVKNLSIYISDTLPPFLELLILNGQRSCRAYHAC